MRDLEMAELRRELAAAEAIADRERQARKAAEREREAHRAHAMEADAENDRLTHALRAALVELDAAPCRDDARHTRCLTCQAAHALREAIS